MKYITSGQNPVIKEIKALKKRKYREERKLYFVEGLRFVAQAVEESRKIEKLLISEEFYISEKAKTLLMEVKQCDCECFVLSNALFDEISETENPQGVLAVMKAESHAFDAQAVKNGFLVILDSIQDPGNLGTIIRTADAAGADGIIVSKGSADVYNPKVLRSTMGSIFHIPIYISDNIGDTIALLKTNGMKVYAAHLEGTLNYFDADLRGSAAVIIGNEASGISDMAAGCADGLLKIPMAGRAESLNASIAAGIIIYESLRQRMKGLI